MSNRRYFTVSEVNAMLPELQTLANRIREQRQEIRQRAAELDRRKVQAEAGADFMQEEAELDFLLGLLKSAYGRVQEFGGEIKHPDATLVDFLGRGPDGEDVWLCWHDGEGEIGFYHPLDQGFTARRPVTPGM